MIIVQRKKFKKNRIIFDKRIYFQLISANRKQAALQIVDKNYERSIKR